jgi:hypothetical protein
MRNPRNAIFGRETFGIDYLCPCRDADRRCMASQLIISMSPDVLGVLAALPASTLTVPRWPLARDPKLTAPMSNLPLLGSAVLEAKPVD